MPDNNRDLQQATRNLLDNYRKGIKQPESKSSEVDAMDRAILTGDLMRQIGQQEQEKANEIDMLNVSDQKKDYLKWVAATKSPEELAWAKSVVQGKTSKQLEDNWFTRGLLTATADAAIGATAGALVGTPFGVAPVSGAIGGIAGAAEGFTRGALTDEANFYIDEKTGMPVPLRAGERIPMGKSLSEVFGNREAEDDLAITSLGKGMYNGFVDIGRTLPNIVNLLQGNFTGKEAEWLNQISNSVDSMKLDVKPEAMTSIVENPSLQNFSYVLGQGLGSLAQFIGGAGLMGTAAKAEQGASIAQRVGMFANPFKNPKALAVSTAINFNEAYDAATIAGLEGGSKSAYVLPTALAVGALELAVGGQEMDLVLKKALVNKTAKKFAVQAAESEGLSVTAESIEAVYKDAIKTGLQQFAAVGKSMFKQGIGEGTEEAIQALTSQIDQVIYDKVSGDPAFNTELGSHKSFVELAENAIAGGLVGFVAGSANLSENRSLDRTLFKAIKSGNDKPLLAQVNALLKNNQITAEDHETIMSKHAAFTKYYGEITKTKAVLNDDEKQELFGEAWNSIYASQQIKEASDLKKEQEAEEGSSTFFDSTIQFYTEKKAKHEKAIQKIMQEGMKRRAAGQEAPATAEEEAEVEEGEDTGAPAPGTVSTGDNVHQTSSGQAPELFDITSQAPEGEGSEQTREERLFAASSLVTLTNSEAFKSRPELVKFIEETLGLKITDSLKHIKEETAAWLEAASEEVKPKKMTAIPRHTRKNAKGQMVPHYSRVHDEISKALESEEGAEIKGEIEAGPGGSTSGLIFKDETGHKITFYNHAPKNPKKPQPGEDPEVSPINVAEDLTAEARIEKGKDFTDKQGNVRKVLNVMIGDRIVGRVRETDEFDKNLPEGTSKREPIKNTTVKKAVEKATEKAKAKQAAKPVQDPISAAFGEKPKVKPEPKQEEKTEEPKSRPARKARPKPTQSAEQPTRGNRRVTRTADSDPTEEATPVPAKRKTKEEKLAEAEARGKQRKAKIDAKAKELLKRKFNPNGGPQTMVTIIPRVDKVADAVYQAAVIVGREALKAGSDLRTAVDKAMIHFKHNASEYWRKRLTGYSRSQLKLDIERELEPFKRVAEMLSKTGYDDEQSLKEASELTGLSIEEIKYMKFGDGNFYAASEKAFNKFFVNDKGEPVDPAVGTYGLKTMAMAFFQLGNPAEADVREMVKGFTASDALRKHWLSMSDADLVQLNNFIKSSVLVPYLHLSNYDKSIKGYGLKVSNPHLSKKGLREILKRKFKRNWTEKNLRETADEALNSYERKKTALKEKYFQAKQNAFIEEKGTYYYINSGSRSDNVVNVAQKLQQERKALNNYTKRGEVLQKKFAKEIKSLQDNIAFLEDKQNQLMAKGDAKAIAQQLLDLDVNFINYMTGIDVQFLRDYAQDNAQGYPSAVDWYMANEKDFSLFKFFIQPNIQMGVDLHLLQSEMGKDGKLTPGFQKTVLESQIGTIGSQQERLSVEQERYAYEFDNVVKDSKSAHEFYSTMTMMAKEVGSDAVQSLPRLANNSLVKSLAGKQWKYFKIDGVKNALTDTAVGTDRISVYDLELIAFSAFLGNNSSIGVDSNMYPQFYDQQSDSSQEYMFVVPKRDVKFFQGGKLITDRGIAGEAELESEVNMVATTMTNLAARKAIDLKGATPQDAARAFVYNYMYNKYEMDQYFRGIDPEIDPKYTYAIQSKRKVNGQGELQNFHIAGGIGTHTNTVIVKDNEIFHPFAPKGKDGKDKPVAEQDGQIIVMDWHNEKIERSSGRKYGGVVKDYYYDVTPEGKQVNFKGNTIVLSKEMAEMNPVWKALYEWAKENQLDRIVFESSAKRGPSTGAVKVLDLKFDKKGMPTNLPKLAKEDVFQARNDRFFIQQNLANDGQTKPGHLPVQLLTVMKRLPAGSAIETQFARVVQIRAQELQAEWDRMTPQKRKEWVISKLPDTPYYISIKNFLRDSEAQINNPAYYDTINNIFQSEIERRVLNIRVNKNVAVTSSLPGSNLKSMRKEGSEVKFGEVLLPYGMSAGDQRITINPDPNAQEVVIVMRSPLDDVHSISVLVPRGFMPEGSKNAILPSPDVNILNGGDHDGDTLHVWTQFKDKKGKIIPYDPNDMQPSPEAVTNHVFSLVRDAFADPANFEAITTPIDHGAVERSIEDIKKEDEGKFKNRYSWQAWKYQVASNKESSAVIGMSINALKVYNDLRAYRMRLKDKSSMELPVWKKGVWTNAKRVLREFFSDEDGVEFQNYKDIGGNLNQVLDNPKLSNLFSMRKLKATTYLFDTLKFLYVDQDTTINFFNHPVVREYVRLVNEQDSPTADKSVNVFRVLEKKYNQGQISDKKVWEKNVTLTKEILSATKDPSANLQVLNFLEYLKHVSDDIESINGVLRANDKAIRSFGSLNKVGIAYNKMMLDKLNAIQINDEYRKAGTAFAKAVENLNFTGRLYDQSFHRTTFASGVIQQILAEHSKARFNPRQTKEGKEDDSQGDYIRGSEEQIDTIVQQLWQWITVQARMIDRDVSTLREEALEIYENLEPDHFLKELLVHTADGKLGLHDDFVSKTPDITMIESANRAFSQLDESDLWTLTDYMIREYGYTSSLKSGSFFAYLPPAIHADVSKSVEVVIQMIKEGLYNEAMNQVTDEIIAKNLKLIPQAVGNQLYHDLGVLLPYDQNDQPLSNPPYQIRIRNDKGKWIVYDLQEFPSETGEVTYGYLEKESREYEDRGFGNNYEYTPSSDEARGAKILSDLEKLDNAGHQEPVEFVGLKAFSAKDTLSGKKENQATRLKKGEINKVITEGRLTRVGHKLKIGKEYYLVKAVTTLDEQGFKDKDTHDMISRHIGITIDKVKKMISTGEINDGSQILTLEKTSGPEQLNLMTGNPMNEQLASKEVALRDFIRDHFAKMYPEIQVFNDPKAFQEFLDKNFPGQTLPMEALGAAIGRSVYINPNTAVQSTDFHEHAHIYWDMLPKNDPSKIQLMKKFGSEEAAILAIGRAGVDVAKDAYGRRPNKEGFFYVLKQFWSAVKKLLGVGTKHSIEKAFAQKIWDANPAVKEHQLLSNTLKLMQSNTLEFPEQGEAYDRLNIILDEMFPGVTLETATDEQIAELLVPRIPVKEDETIWQTLWQTQHNTPLGSHIYDAAGQKVAAMGNLPVMPKEEWAKAKYGVDYQNILREASRGNSVALQQVDHFYKEYESRMKAINDIINKELRTEEDIYNASDKELNSILESMKSKELLNQDNKGFDPTAEMIRKAILDRMGARFIARAVRDELKADNRTNRAFLRALAAIRENQDVMDISSLASGWFGKDLTGAFISPGDLKSQKGQLHQQIHDRVHYRKTRDFAAASERLHNAYAMLRKHKINVKDLVIPAQGNEVDKWLMENSLDGMRDHLLSQYSDEQIEVIRDFMNTREAIIDEYRAALTNPNQVDSVAYAQADFPELLQRYRKENGIMHAIAKTFRVKNSKEAPYDHLTVSYRDTNGQYLRLSEVKQDIELQVALHKQDPTKGMTEKQATAALFKYGNEAKQMWNDRSHVYDKAGELIDRSHQRTINLRTQFGQDMTTTDNLEASDIQFLERLIYKYHADPYVPMLEFISEYAGRSNQEQLQKYLQNMDSHRLYGENPASRTGGAEPYIKFLNGYTVLKLLALNFGVAPFNMFAALAQNTREFGYRKTLAGMITALGGIDRGKWTTKPSTDVEKGFIDNKIFNILRKQELVEVGHNLEVSTSSKFFQRIKKFLFFPTTFAEFVNHATTVAALMSKQQLDAYDAKGNVIDEKNALTEDQWISLINEARRIHGAYHETRRRPIGFTAEGQAVMLMKNWLPDVLKAHFQKEFIDANDITRKGIFNSAYDSFLDVFYPKNEDGVREATLLPGEWAENYQALSELDKMNLRKGMRELVMLGLIAFLYAGATDDKEAQRKLGRAFGDVAFFYDISNWQFLLTNPLPTASAVTDILEVVRQMTDTLAGKDTTYKKAGKYGEKGDSKIPAMILETLPGNKLIEQVTE